MESQAWFGEDGSGEARRGKTRQARKPEMIEREKSAAIRKELEVIAKQGDGVLQAEAVVEFARDKSTALHSEFNWDNTDAAHKWRLHQARNLIRVQVTFEPRSERKMQVFVSLPSDREDDGGGYRRMVDVLSNADKREQLVASALAEMEVFQRKYAAISELADVFAAMRKFKGKSTNQRKAS
jgi:hypothetical protein